MFFCYAPIIFYNARADVRGVGCLTNGCSGDCNSACSPASCHAGDYHRNGAVYDYVFHDAKVAKIIHKCKFCRHSHQLFASFYIFL